MVCPLLWVNADGEEAQIRLKYMDTVTRLYNENFTNVIGDWCRAHGVDYLGHTIEDNGAHARLGYGTGHFFRGQEGMDFSGIDVIGGQVVPGMHLTQAEATVSSTTTRLRNSGHPRHISTRRRRGEPCARRLARTDGMKDLRQ